MKQPMEPPELPEGLRLLDRYTIIDRVGSGGMASIYRAMDERLDRVVCVKLLRLVLEGSGSTSGRSVYQATYSHFLQEALALSRLQHPNTLRIYDFGYLADNGRPFQISEFLDGGNLEMHVKARGAMPAEEASAILERICGAVAEAHQHKIIHRDIKPSNILFARVGDFLIPKLADFGIAHSNLRKRPKTSGGVGFEDDTGTGEMVSTVTLFSPRWAAPEQLAGAPQGAATDVYALGLVAVYMLAGRPLFEGNDVRGTFGERIRGDDLVTFLLEGTPITPATQRVLVHAMAAIPERRYATPLDFYDAIRKTLGSAHAKPPPVVPSRGSEVTLTVEREVLPPGPGSIPEIENVPVPVQAVRIPTPPPPPASSAQLRRPTPAPFSPRAAGAPAPPPPPPRGDVVPPPASSSSAPTAVSSRSGAFAPAAPSSGSVALPGSSAPASAGPVTGMGRHARLVQVDEKIDLTVQGNVLKGVPAEIRFRVSFVPARDQSFKINVKGLNCFVKIGTNRPTPAIAADSDGALEFISTAWEHLGRIAWSFGQPRATNADGPRGPGRVFRLDEGELVIPSTQASQAVAIYLGKNQDVIVLCRP